MANSVQIAKAYSIRPLFTAILVVAMALTLSCSGDDGGGGGGNGSGSNVPQGELDLCKNWYDYGLSLPPVPNCNDKETIKIGSQIWHKCNLKVVPSKGAHACLCNKPENCDKYGRLYDWEAAMSACPSGFHLPTTEEWSILVNYAGGEDVAGDKLKATSGWRERDGYHNGTDDFGFAALPAGMYTYTLGGAFAGGGDDTDWLTATEYDGDASRVYTRRIYGHQKWISNSTYYYSDKTMELHSVRCVKD